MYISKETTTELDGNKIRTKEIFKIVVGEMDGKKVYCEIDCEPGYFDIQEFYISLDDISSFKARGYPSRFQSYHSSNFNDFCLVETNHTKWNEYIKKRIRDEIHSLEMLLEKID